MHFALDEQQAMIADIANRVFADNFGRETTKRFVATGQLEDGWRTVFGETGMLGICASPDVGGLGLGCVAALAVAHGAGAQAAPFPVSEGIAAAAALIRLPEVVQAVIEGRAIVAIADARITVARHGDSIILTGALGPVGWAGQAQGLIICARDESGLDALYFVDGAAGHIVLGKRGGIDLTTPVADVYLTDAPALSLGPPPAGWHQLRTVLAAAELEGAARTSLNLALEHMKTRRQFGQEIGKFQALKHIAASDALHIESMSLANAYAAWAIDTGADDAVEAVAIAKSYASDAARTVAQDAVQCHGGIGFTWDYGLHFFLRRILRLAASLGTAHDHRETLFEILTAARPARGE